MNHGFTIHVHYKNAAFRKQTINLKFLTCRYRIFKVRSMITSKHTGRLKMVILLSTRVMTLTKLLRDVQINVASVILLASKFRWHNNSIWRHVAVWPTLYMDSLHSTQRSFSVGIADSSLSNWASRVSESL